jgi:L-ribulokinase
MGRPLMISRSSQTCALGSAIAGAVVAGKSAGGYDSFDKAVAAMTGVQKNIFKPIKANVAVYDRLYRIYRQLHDSLGVGGSKQDISALMKQLLEIRDKVRKNA